MTVPHAVPAPASSDRGPGGRDDSDRGVVGRGGMSAMTPEDSTKPGGVRVGHSVRTTKALRLVSEGRVTPIPLARVYAVAGDSATYLVTIGPGIRRCDCPYGTNALAEDACSHVVAAGLYEARQATADDPFAGIPSEKDLP